MTTSKRFDLWLKTVTSLRHVDMDEIHRCVIIDNESPAKEVADMLSNWSALFPKIPVSVMHNDIQSRFKHQHSMECWRSITHTEEFVFHLEDDCQFCAGAETCLLWARSVLFRYSWIGQAMLGKRASTIPIEPAEFWIMTQDNSTEYAPSRFSLQPSVIRMSTIRNTGGFRYVENFEVEFGYRWAGRGYQTVYHPTGYCEHRGTTSSYDINGSLR